MTTPLLELDALEKRFGSTLAVDRVSLSIASGEIVALVGENGAGKTTLLSLLTGIYKPDAGSIRVDGQPLALGNPRRAEAAGIGLVPQHSELVGPLTVAENAVLGREPRRGLAFDRRRAEREVEAVAARHGLPVDVRARADTLSVSGKQRAEIVKLLWRGARVLALDEPTATLAPAEIASLLDTLSALAREGRGIILVSHKLAEVQRIANRIAVLRKGRLEAILDGRVSLERVAAAMSQGEEPRAALPAKPVTHGGEPVLRLQGAATADDRGQEILRDLSLSIAAGEIVGIAGVDGNGQRELVELIVGIRPLLRGALFLRGGDASNASIGKRRALGVAYIPEDRMRGGLCDGLSSEENLALGRAALVSRFGVIRPRQLRARAQSLLASADVRPRAPELRTGGLSGGNQQKLLLARELDGQRALIVAAHPTRGLDPTATDQVHRSLLAQAAGGAGALVVSQDLDELRTLSNRILVLFRGAVVADLPAPAATDACLSQAMLGGAVA